MITNGGITASPIKPVATIGITTTSSPGFIGSGAMLPRAPISVCMHKPLSRSVAAGRVAHQCFSSILKMIKRFHQRNAWTLFVTTFRSDTSLDDYRLDLDACWCD
jgi:hypothetical protein